MRSLLPHSHLSSTSVIVASFYLSRNIVAANEKGQIQSTCTMIWGLFSAVDSGRTGQGSQWLG
jgi:hypothetical protein